MPIRYLGKSQRPRDPVQVAAVGVFAPSKMLWGKRWDSGLYTGPAGHLEPDEDPRVGAARELYEEAGIRVDPAELQDLGARRSGRVEVHCFRLDLSAEVPVTNENDPDEEFEELRWIALENGLLPAEIADNLHVPMERNALLSALGMVPEGLGKAEGTLPRLELGAQCYGDEGAEVSIHPSGAGYTITWSDEQGDLGTTGCLSKSEVSRAVGEWLAKNGPTDEHLAGEHGRSADRISQTADSPASHHVAGLRHASAARLYGNAGNREKAAYHQQKADEHVQKSGIKPKKAAKPRAPKAKPEAPKNLVVQHNISAKGLENAHKLGALPAPSIAVAHQDHPLTGFGEVSLVAHPSLVDPKQKVPLFDADVYSPRYPRAKNKINEKEYKQFSKELQPHIEATSRYGYRHLDDSDFRRDMEHDTPADFAKNRGQVQYALGLQYLRSKGEDPKPPTRRVPTEFDFAEHPEIQAIAAEHPRHSIKWKDSDKIKMMSQAVDRAIDAHSQKKYGKALDPEELKDLTRGLKRRVGIVDENGQPTGTMHWNKIDTILEDAKKVGQSEPDVHAFQDSIHKRVSEDPEFHKFVEQKLGPLQGEQYIEHGRKKVPHTLENVLRALIKKPVRGGEDAGSFGGSGQTRALGARKFSSLDQAKQHSHKLVDHRAFEAAKETFHKQLGDLADEVRPDLSAFQRMDSVNDLLADYIKNHNLDRALRDNGAQNVSESTKANIRQAAQDLLNMPTEYFEAKPQRAVGLNEFKGAAIPHTAPQRTRDILRHHGVHTEEYQSGDEEDRKRAIQKIAREHDLLLSEDDFWGEDLGKTQPGITFPKMGLGDDQRPTPIVNTTTQLESKLGLMDAAARRAHPGAHIDSLVPASRTAAGSASNSAPISYSRGPALRPNDSHPHDPLSTQLHEDVHQMFSRVQAKHGPSARKTLARNLVHSMPDELRQAAENFSHWKNKSYVGNQEETISNLVSYLNNPHERYLFRTQALGFHGYPAERRNAEGYLESHPDKSRRLLGPDVKYHPKTQGPQHALALEHDQRMKRAMAHLRSVAAQADDSWARRSKFWEGKSIEKSEPLQAGGDWLCLEKGETAPRDVLVCIPRSRLASVEAEEKQVAEQVAAGHKGATYWWSVGRLPKQLPARVYFVWDGAIRAYHECVGSVSSPGPRLLLDHEIHDIEPVPAKAFRGWRYFTMEQYSTPNENGAGLKKGEEVPEQEEGLDEIAQLLSHPDPVERGLALKLGGVRRHHIVQALLSPDPALQATALAHSALDDEILRAVVSTEGNWELKRKLLARPELPGWAMTEMVRAALS